MKPNLPYCEINLYVDSKPTSDEPHGTLYFRTTEDALEHVDWLFGKRNKYIRALIREYDRYGKCRLIAEKERDARPECQKYLRGG